MHLPETIEYRDTDALIPYARNARTHTAAQIDAVARSMREFGWTNPVLISGDGTIIAGHARVLAAKKLKLPSVPVIVLDYLTDAQRRAYILADNKLAEQAGWDEELLRIELPELKSDDFDLSVIGFSDDELSALLDEPAGDYEGNTDPDDVPEVQEAIVSRPGDVWVLGPHRLLVGDATSQSDVERLMGGARADMVFTDPPYNVDYEGYTEEKLKIKGDKMTPEQFQLFLSEVFAAYRGIVKSGASVYVCHSSSWQREFQNAIEAAGFDVRCQIIWAKNTFAWGFGRYKFQHEPIFYVHVAGESDSWYGDKTQSTLWQEKKPAANRLHPTMKPVELIERALANSSKSGDLVVDLFGGSGSTMIACERLGRHARLMEIDPRYADVIVRRWQEHTGGTAAFEDGTPFGGAHVNSEAD